MQLKSMNDPIADRVLAGRTARQQKYFDKIQVYYPTFIKYFDILLITIAFLALFVGIAAADTRDQTYPISGALSTVGYSNLTTSSIEFQGSYSGAGEFFIVFGSQSGIYPFKTENDTGPGTKKFLVQGMPLLTNRTYYYRTAAYIGDTEYFGEEKSVFITALTPVPTTTYGVYLEDFLDTRGDYVNLSMVIWKPYEAKLGMFFYSILIGMVFVAMWQRSGSVLIPFLAFTMTGFLLMMMMRPEFVQLAQACFIGALTGLVFWFFTGGK